MLGVPEIYSNRSIAMKNAYQFDFTKNEFVFTNGDCKVLTGRESLKQWIEKILRTQLGAYAMYTSYGSNINDLVLGSAYNADFTDTELKREIEDALLKNDDILSVDRIEITRNRKSLSVDISTTTVYGKESEVYGL